MLKIKVYIEPSNFSDDLKIRQNKNFLLENKDGDNSLPRLLLLIFNNQPTTTTQLTTLFNNNYHTDFDRCKTSRYVAKLISRGLVAWATPIEAHSLIEKKEIHYNIIDKHRLSYDHVPLAFQGKYIGIHYFWITLEGERYITFCCEKLGIKYERLDKEEEEKIKF
jgi:hypothetical protein